MPTTPGSDRIVAFPVVMQRQGPTIQTVQKTVEVPQSQYLDRVVDVLVVKQRGGAATEFK